MTTMWEEYLAADQWIGVGVETLDRGELDSMNNLRMPDGGRG